MSGLHLGSSSLLVVIWSFSCDLRDPAGGNTPYRTPRSSSVVESRKCLEVMERCSVFAAPNKVMCDVSDPQLTVQESCMSESRQQHVYPSHSHLSDSMKLCLFRVQIEGWGPYEKVLTVHWKILSINISVGRRGFKFCPTVCIKSLTPLV